MKMPEAETLDMVHMVEARVPSYFPPVIMLLDDPLFILYVGYPHDHAFQCEVSTTLSQTSGSTGKPKGVVLTTGGYLLGTALTVTFVFDLHPVDRFACMADVGWITRHSHILIHLTFPAH